MSPSEHPHLRPVAPTTAAGEAPAAERPGEAWDGISRPRARNSGPRFLTDVIVELGLAARERVDEAIGDRARRQCDAGGGPAAVRRFRIDGVLPESVTVPRRMVSGVISRVKVGGIVGFIVISTCLPLFKVYDSIR